MLTVALIIIITFVILVLVLVSQQNPLFVPGFVIGTLLILGLGQLFKVLISSEPLGSLAGLLIISGVLLVVVLFTLYFLWGSR